MRTQKSKKAKRKPPAERCVARAERVKEQALGALEHLRLIQHGAHITELYRKFFPEEFARDLPNYGDARELLGHYDRFATLVHERLFPVYTFSDNELVYSEPESILHTMQVVSLNNWLWYDRGQYLGPEDLHVVEKLVASAADHEHLFPDVNFRLPAGHRFSLPLLNDACLEEKGRVSSLGLVAEAVLGGTGNVWLDISEEEYWAAEQPEWTEEQIKFLAGEFAEAKRMMKEIRKFFDWCDSPGKVERVKRLLRGCWVREGERVKVRATPAPTLVESLGGLL